LGIKLIIRDNKLWVGLFLNIDLHQKEKEESGKYL